MADRGRTRHRQRWGDAADKNSVALMLDIPVALTGPLTAEQLDAYALNFRIREISEKLKLNDVVPVERSPSPPPQYDQDGKRTNTREIRYRAKLEQERHLLVEKAIRLIPKFKPPSDYRPAKKTQEKIYIPANDYPEVNFIGLLIGPRGKTLQKMEMESGARIAIRGKGSVKEGKGRTNENLPHVQSLSEDLHCLIVADTEEKINKAVELVNKIIETAASTPESQNDLKRGQLRELAALNGTLRDWENQPCQNCGEIGHRKYDCPNRKNFTASVICRICGGQGHFARDCKERRSAGGPRNGGGYKSAADREYDQLMLELGNGGPSRFGSGANSTPLAIEGGPSRTGNSSQGSAGSSWQQGPPNPSPWQQSAPPPNAPWKTDGPAAQPPGASLMPPMPAMPAMPSLPGMPGPPGFAMGAPPGAPPVMAPPPPSGQFFPAPPPGAPPPAPPTSAAPGAPPSLPPPPPGAPPPSGAPPLAY